jgi:flagellin-specific chaperone FliS
MTRSTSLYKLFIKTLEQQMFSKEIEQILKVVEVITALLVSSQLKNGDEITDTFNNSVAIYIFKDQLTFQNSLSHD